jgi:hypothetical protein
MFDVQLCTSIYFSRKCTKSYHALFPFGRCVICVFCRAAVPVPALHTRQARGEDPPLLPEGGELQRQAPPDQAGYITNQYAYQETRNFMQQVDSKSVEMGQ